MRRIPRAIVPLAFAAVTGCYSLPVSTTVVMDPGTRVTADAEKLNILWLSPLPPETSADLLEDLMKQCGNRGVTGVTIGTQTGWVLIGQQEKIVATGYCVE